MYRIWCLVFLGRFCGKVRVENFYKYIVLGKKVFWIRLMRNEKECLVCVKGYSIGD